MPMRLSTKRSSYLIKERIETATTEHKIWIRKSLNDSAFVEASLNAPNKGPAFDDLKIDLGGTKHTRAASVDVGNPHLVIEVEDIEIVDNSQKHKTHKFFNKNKYHYSFFIF